MIAYVVNLARRADRRRQFLEWNRHHEMTYRFVDAVDGATVDRQPLIAAGILSDGAEAFSAGAVGCALSHRRIWEICMRSDQVSLILEDDACLRHDFVGTFDAVLARAGEAWDILFVGYNTDVAMTVQLAGGLTAFLIFAETPNCEAFFTHFAGAATTVQAPLLTDARLVWGTLGYAVTPRGAERLLEHCFPMRTSAPVSIPFHGIGGAIGIDGMISSAMQRGLVAGKCCFPPLVLGPNDKSTSDIGPPPT